MASLPYKCTERRRTVNIQSAMRASLLLRSLLSLPSALAVVTASSTTSARCKCLYGQSCWPSQQAFDTLQAKLSRPLLRPLPAASPCYVHGQSSDECQDVRLNYREGLWRADLPGVTQHTNYNAYIFPNNTISRCPLDPVEGQSCGQGSVPPIGVDARSPEDIQEAIRFAKHHNLKLVVQNTGHDFLGRSAARDGFMIWTHRMKDISFHESFVPLNQTGTPGSDAVTLGAGVQWFEAYAAVQAQGKTIVGGASTNGTVGAAGGWVLGGGHSALAPTFGFGVDNVLEFRVVLADARYVTVNAHSNPRLFWALRGGGGAFGVVTSVTYRIHPRLPNTGIFIVANFTSPAVAQQVTTEFIRLHPTLSDMQWGGYSSFTNSGFQFFWIAPNVNEAKAQDNIAPLTNFLANVTGGQFINATLPFDSFHDWLDFTFRQAGSQVGVGLEISSRLLSKESALSRPEEIAKTVLSLPGGASFNSVAGGAASRIDPDSSAFNPAWRKAITEVIISQTVDIENESIDTIRAAQERLRKGTRVLDTITTDSAAYYNEATLHELDFRKSFWGSHYPRLKEIKNQYDPTSLFLVRRGVGSEEWDDDLICRT